MAFKMKAGKEGPMRKNFGKDISPMNKPLVGNQKNLPDHLKQKILDSPAKLKTAKLAKSLKKKIKKQDILAGPVSRVISKDKVDKAKKLITDVNQGVGKAVKRKESPKKILGSLAKAALGPLGGMAAKALGNKKVRKGIGRVGGTMLQAFGGPLGGMAGKAMGGMLMKKAPNKMKKKK